MWAMMSGDDEWWRTTQQSGQPPTHAPPTHAPTHPSISNPPYSPFRRRKTDLLLPQMVFSTSWLDDLSSWNLPTPHSWP